LTLSAQAQQAALPVIELHQRQAREAPMIHRTTVILLIGAIFLAALDAGNGLWTRTAIDIFIAVICALLLLRQIRIRQKLRADAVKEWSHSRRLP
jgi:hypothetical protein